MSTSDYSAVMLNGTKKMIMAYQLMDETDYVVDTYQQYRKRNPMIAYSNTKLADRNNIQRFDGYAQEAIAMCATIPDGAFADSELLKELAFILFTYYNKEEEALCNRLNIYDSSLDEKARKSRDDKKRQIKRNMKPAVGEGMERFTELLEQNAALEIKKMCCLQKISANTDVCQEYSQKLLWRKNAQRTVQQAQEFINYHKAEMAKIEATQKDNQTQISSLL